MNWIEENPVGAPFVVFLWTVFLVTILIPYSTIATVVGYAFSKVYGSVWAVIAVGTVVIFFGSFIGSFIAFLLGRYLCRNLVKKCMEKSLILQAIEKTMQTKGLRLMLLMRLSLLIPFNVSNYVLGGTPVNWKDYLMSNIGILPLVIFFVYLGSTFSNIQDFLNGRQAIDTMQIVVMSLGGLLVLCVLLAISCYVKKTISEEMIR